MKTHTIIKVTSVTALAVGGCSVSIITLFLTSGVTVGPADPPLLGAPFLGAPKFYLGVELAYISWEIVLLFLVEAKYELTQNHINNEFVFKFVSLSLRHDTS